MCGIAGWIGPEPLPRERVDACLARMGHRGPDHRADRAFSTGAGQHVHLLHARLSILDLDARSNQPLRFGATWVATNGEIYNYRELAAEFAGQLHTTSDTEVLAALLERDGAGALDRCEGMWAFAAHDERTGATLLSRDRFGEKPLHLLRADGGIYFGSEPKFLAALAGRPLTPNRAQLRRYIVNGYKSLYKTTDTFFAGVEQLPAGTNLEIAADGTSRLVRYWDPGPPQQQDAMSRAEAVAATRERLIRAVELRLRADVPLAFCLSGGVDSQALVSIARREFDLDVHGFTIVNTDERYEEQDIIDRSIAELGIRHQPIALRTEGFLGNLRRLVRHHDSPVSTITYYVHWLLMESIAAHGYRVSISGTAADELFSGYFDHHLAYLREVRGDAELHARSLAAWRTHIAPIVRNPYLSNPDLFVDDPGELRHIYLGADEFATYLRDPFDEPFAETDYTDDVLRKRMLNELFHEAVPVILHEDDLNAMFFSIENRSPFLDRDLYELAATIPTRHLVHDGAAKSVLREAMRGIVPDVVLDSRRKVGFNAPIEALLDRDDPAVRTEILADGPLYELVRRERVVELLDRPELPNSASKTLFNLLNVKLFLEELGGAPPPP
jgi:asparagine synthase (glutamine-hydrolysing)